MSNNISKSSKKKEPAVHPLILVLIALTLGAVGQLLLKQGISGINISGTIFQQLMTLFRAVFTPFVFFGIMMYAISALFWLKVLSTQELSYVYPMIAVSYVTVTILSIIFLHEHVSPMRWIALFIICLGVAMLAIWGNDQKDTAKGKPEIVSEGQVSSAQNPQIGSKERLR